MHKKADGGGDVYDMLQQAAMVVADDINCPCPKCDIFRKVQAMLATVYRAAALASRGDPTFMDAVTSAMLEGIRGTEEPPEG